MRLNEAAGDGTKYLLSFSFDSGNRAITAYPGHLSVIYSDSDPSAIISVPGMSLLSLFFSFLSVC